MKLSIITSRPIGEKCKEWAISQGYKLYAIEDCDVLISIMYDKLIPEDFIKSHKCYNFHPGVLPWYRGAGAYSWAIINGEFETGVTLHEIDKDIDHGNVISIERFPISKKDTAETLFRKAEETIFELFKYSLSILATKDIITTIQEEGKIYYRKDLEKAKDLTRYVRAFTFEGKDNCFYYNSKGEKIELKWN
jgi:methionyl-tRNA formyltransferase